MDSVIHMDREDDGRRIAEAALIFDGDEFEWIVDADPLIRK